MNQIHQISAHSLRIFLAILPVILAGCASTQTDDELLPYGAKEIDRGIYNDCFFANSVSDWKPLDDENLIVFAPHRRAHHVQLSRRSFNLNSTIGISFVDRDGRICPYGGDDIIIGVGLNQERIGIRSIKRISDAELAYLYDQFEIERPSVKSGTDEETDTESQTD